MFPTAANVKRLLEAAGNPDPRPWLEGILADARRIEAAEGRDSERGERAREIWFGARCCLDEIELGRAGVAVARALLLCRLLRDELLLSPWAATRHRSLEELAVVGLGRTKNPDAARQRRLDHADTRREDLRGIWKALAGRGRSEGWRYDQAAEALRKKGHAMPPAAKRRDVHKRIRDDLYALDLKLPRKK